MYLNTSGHLFYLYGQKSTGKCIVAFYQGKLFKKPEPSAHQEIVCQEQWVVMRLKSVMKSFTLNLVPGRCGLILNYVQLTSWFVTAIMEKKEKAIRLDSAPRTRRS